MPPDSKKDPGQQGQYHDQQGAEKNRRVVFVIESADETAPAVSQNNMN